jgi:hypothetical protein
MTSNGGPLPNLIIAGVHKAGTTSLYSYLSKHPQVCASFTKEISFFRPLLLGEDLPPIDEYSSFFTHCRAETFRMEASPTYFYGGELIARRMQQELGDIKVIVVFRDPTDRLVSFFKRAVSKSVLPESLEFADYIEMSRRQAGHAEYNAYTRGVREGKYIDYLKPWHEIFGKNLKVLFFEDLKRDAHSFTANTCEWLGLSDDCYGDHDFTIENKTFQYRNRRFHKYMMGLYLGSESFWRRNDTLKKKLRKIYFLFNVDRGKRLETVDDATILQLKELYSPYNIELKKYLLSLGYDDLPAWLE